MALPPPNPLSTCLITGASSGIGADIARELARRGHGVTLVARREDRLQELADELRKGWNVSAETVACDLTDPKSRAKMVEEVEGLGLKVEVLINNAGFGSGGAFHALDADGETEMVRINVEALVGLTGHYLPGMVERHQGAVLNLGSLIAFQPVPNQATYGASKAFVLSFTESIHEELRDTGVTMSALCPGPVKTEFGEVGGFGGADDNIPSFAWLTPDKVAAAGVEGLEKGRRVIVPGTLNQLGAFGGQHMPRGVLLPLVSRLWPVS